MKHAHPFAPLGFCLCLLATAPLLAGEFDIVRDLEAFFTTDSPAERERLAARIAADPACRREALSSQLQKMRNYPSLPPARSTFAVPVGFSQVRTVTLRLPRGYTSERRWPLIYALHPSGGDGPSFLNYMEALLGPRVDDFVIAAPTGYRQTGLDAPPPFTVDHPAILLALRQRVPVDAGRQYAVGYSLGGYATWAIACLHSDELAGAVPIASAFSIPPTDDGVWRAMVPNIQALPILNVWGALDNLTVYGIDGRVLGGIASLNRPFASWVRGLAPLLQNVEIPGAGHGDVRLPSEPFFETLSKRRTEGPLRVEHNFRHLHQGRAYWLEAHTWSGARWDAALPEPTPNPGESRDRALGRAVVDLLGHLEGSIEGQTIRVKTRHVDEMTVWIGGGMVDWKKPVTLVVNEREVFAERLEHDLLVCLNEAARRRDFHRLRWAGLRVHADGTVERVTGRTAFPPLFPGGQESKPRDRSREAVRQSARFRALAAGAA